MLRRITRNKQVTIPKEFMGRLHLNEGDYVSIECDDDSIRLRAVDIQEFSRNDYKKLASKLDQLKKERGTRHKDSTSARKHLKNLMK
ncbi:MAG: AbrB/MazE/SpoVT family DNA-binding domain-containing protein [Deltaproteobacteria bacterium]|nr:AbrB/MazE/SpoVT family DNA-binding domain-containing protein [Deltaproteobacteria bacterium]